MRIKTCDIPALRDRIAAEQGMACGICGVDLRSVKMCLDHDHRTGVIRGVLCQNCNGIEGKVSNLANRGKRQGTRYGFIQSVLAYWDRHSTAQRQELHPLHRTADEKRLLRNKRARKRRAEKKS
jgi:hypothetical protein